MPSEVPLPELYTRPSCSALLAALEALKQAPSSFESTYENDAESLVDAREVRSYLTALVSSPLTWLANDDEREQVWEVASRRLSERAGRSARPAHDRTLTIPSASGSLSITLHEPTLTADRLGHKTWAAGYLLAKRIPSLASHVPLLDASSSTSESSPPLILELGSGTGLVGLALAHHLPAAFIHLTDLEDIVPNLATNTERNHPSSASPPRIRVFPLDWYAVPPEEGHAYTCARTDTAVSEVRQGAYELVIAADVLYGPEHPPLVARAAAYFLKTDSRARVVIEVPRRERDGGLVEALQREMEGHQLHLMAHGDEEGWEEMGRDEGRVACWWGVWCWKELAGGDIVEAHEHIES